VKESYKDNLYIEKLMKSRTLDKIRKEKRMKKAREGTGHVSSFHWSKGRRSARIATVEQGWHLQIRHWEAGLTVPSSMGGWYLSFIRVVNLLPILN
jgi:hypothetical protein